MRTCIRHIQVMLPNTPHMLTRLFMFIAFAVMPGVLLALGDNSDEGGSANLVAKESYAAEVVDARGAVTSADRISWDGKSYIKGKRGASQVVIPFEKISKVSVAQNGNANTAAVSLTLKDGTSLEILAERRSKLYGIASFGSFELYIRDISSVTFR